jgi:hypothetical protein
MHPCNVMQCLSLFGLFIQYVASPDQTRRHETADTYTITADVRQLFDAKSRDRKLYSEEGEVQSPGLCNRPGGGAKVV